MKRLLLSAIRWYQRAVSPRHPARCRFSPSCSEYTAVAIERFGVCKGCALGLWRILRCNPWGGSGYDPVPPKPPRKS